MQNLKNINSIGLLGFGAFGRLIFKHLTPHFRIQVHDPAVVPSQEVLSGNVGFADLEGVAHCDLVVLAVPVSEFKTTIVKLRPFLQPGTIVLDVGSVKMNPAAVMLAELPPFVEIIGTHPLFGPQSTRHGIAGRKIAVCPIRGKSAFRVAAFLKRALKLDVFVTSPEEHDREAAVVQGITHLIAQILVRMEPLPRRLTTASFDQLLDATEMVRHDAPSVYTAIEQLNPFASEIRDQFFKIAEQVRLEVDGHKTERLFESAELSAQKCA